MTAVLVEETTPEAVEAEVVVLPRRCVIRYPANMGHEHLNRLFWEHPWLEDTGAAALPQTLFEGLVMGV